MHRITWWNVGNLFDDHDDPHTDDFIRQRFEYVRDLKEIAQIIGSLHPMASLVGLGEVENHRVVNDLIKELHWHPRHPDYHCNHYVDSRDPRGIDVAYMHRQDQALRVDHVEALYPNDRDAVRPLLLIHARLHGHLIHIAFLHSKSRRSGPTHSHDDTPGSRIRFAYAYLIRKLALQAGGSGIPFIAMGDFNDEPNSPALIHGAQAWNGRPKKERHYKDHRLYNLSNEMAADAKGTHCYHGHWAFLDQVLVNGCLLRGEHIRIVDRPHIHTHKPLLYRGEPNRWYSDHLPISINLALNE